MTKLCKIKREITLSMVVHSIIQHSRPALGMQSLRSVWYMNYVSNKPILKVCDLRLSSSLYNPTAFAILTALINVAPILWC